MNRRRLAILMLAWLPFVGSPANAIESVCDNLRHALELLESAAEAGEVLDPQRYTDLTVYLELLQVELAVAQDKACAVEPPCVETRVNGTVACVNPESL